MIDKSNLAEKPARRLASFTANSRAGAVRSDIKVEPDADVWLYSETTLPTEYGSFKVQVYHNRYDMKEHLAIVEGDISDGRPVLARLHSECLTSEVLGSLKCDCRDQLQTALRRIHDEGRGVVLYLRQEGRGIGLGNKIRAYGLQEQGYDTVDANRMIGFPDDLRQYDVAASILKNLGVSTVRLMTNNPAKIKGLEENGIAVSERVALQIAPNPLNTFYLETKKKKSGHLLELVG